MRAVADLRAKASEWAMLSLFSFAVMMLLRSAVNADTIHALSDLMDPRD